MRGIDASELSEGGEEVDIGGEWLLGLIHGKPCDLQAVVGTEGCDGKTVG